jgi:putative DNA primase/helicase
MAKKSRHRHEERIKRAKARLSAALLYGSCGAPVVPLHGIKNGCCTCGERQCKWPGRHPRTKLGIADATIHPEEIRRWCQKWPNPNFGIVMGWPGKLVALATDGQAGRQTLQAITAKHGKLPATITIRDHDRRICLFEVDGKPPLSREIANGVRILGDCEVIVAPSTLSGPNNKRHFASGRAPGQCKIAKIPQWLLQISAKGGSDQSACESQQRLARSKSAGFPSNDGDGDSRPLVTNAADVARKNVEWLWPERIALGKLSVIAGHPGLGKSQLAAFMAATVSTGCEWPCCEGRAPLGSVMMLMGEDDPGDTIRPRLEAANADLSRVHLIDTSDHDFDLFSEMQRLEQEIQRVGDVRLIIIDPVTAFSKSGNVQRSAANRLRQLAVSTGAAVVAVSHLSKTNRASALMQVIGSLGLVAVARATYIVANEQGTDRRLFLLAKNNLAVARNLAYRIEPKITPNGAASSAVVWDPTLVTLSADEALACASGPAKQQPALTDATDFLTLMLSAGPMRAKGIMSEARDAGVSFASLRRAAASLKVTKRRVGGLAGGGYWIWQLPEESPPDGAGARALANMPLDAE